VLDDDWLSDNGVGMDLDIALVEGVLDIALRRGESSKSITATKSKLPSKIPASSPHLSADNSGIDRKPSSAKR
jgi:hypothetical protein